MSLDRGRGLPDYCLRTLRAGMERVALYRQRAGHQMHVLPTDAQRWPRAIASSEGQALGVACGEVLQFKLEPAPS